MNHTDFKEKIPSPRVGRGFLVIIVILSSSLSFTLGYFVGKSGTEGKPELAPQITEPAPVPAPQNQEAGKTVAATTADAPAQNYAQASDIKEESRQEAVQTPAASPEKRGKEPATQPAKAPPISKGNAAQGEPLAVQKEDEVKYTVQLGALKSAAEARRLKAKLEKKGYKTYIAVSTNKKKHEKIYKIRTGEFDDKKEAEMLALKLRTTDGLNTFVTPKN